jgi:pyruvate-ferredoxin/flavodoxin oxidoreductase
MGAKDEQTLRAFVEAEAYDGPSLIIAYSHCIAHGIRMSLGMQNQRAAVRSGQWLLYRYAPANAELGKNPLQLDSEKSSLPLADYFAMENRFRMLAQTNPEAAREALGRARQDVAMRRELFEHLAARSQPATS